MKYYTSQPYEIHLYDSVQTLNTVPSLCTLIYVISGTVTLLKQDHPPKTYTTGGIFLFPQNTSAEFSIQPGDSSWYSIIQIDTTYMAAFNQNNHVVFDVDTSSSPYQNYIQLNQAIQKLIDDYFHPETATRTRIGNNLEQCLQILLQNHLHPDTAKLAPNTVESRRIYKLKCYLDTHSQQNLTLEEVASRLNMTPQYTSLYIKRTFGISFIKYVTTVRLDIVRKYLIYTNKTVTQIAPLSGFPNTISLNTAFKNQYNCTPMEYRRLYQKSCYSYSMLYADNDSYESDLKKYALIPDSSVVSHSQTLKTDLHFGVDTRQTTKANFLPKTDILNLQDCRELSSPDNSSVLDHICRELPLRYVRLTGLHAPQHFIAPETDPVFAFRLSIQIIETILNKGLFPMFLCPISSNDGNADRFLPFIDYCINFFGPKCVEQWIFEFSLPTDAPTGDMDQSLKDIVSCIKGLKERLPNCIIDGFSFSSLNKTEYILKVFNTLKEADIIPNYFSYHMTSTFYEANSNEIVPTDYQLSINSELLLQRLSHFLRTKENVFGNTSIGIIAEITFNAHEDSMLNDSLFNATYLLMNAIKMASSIHHLVLPNMSDLTCFSKPLRPALFFGCNSLYTHFGIPKPTLFAIKMFGSLKGQILSSGPYHMVTLDAHQCIRIILCNHKFPDAIYCSNPHIQIAPKKFYSLFADLPPETYTISIDTPNRGRYFIETQTLSKTHGSVLDVWLDADTPKNYPRSLIKHQELTIHPNFQFVCAKSNGTLFIEETLDSLEIKFIKIYPAQEQELFPI